MCVSLVGYWPEGEKHLKERKSFWEPLFLRITMANVNGMRKKDGGQGVGIFRNFRKAQVVHTKNPMLSSKRRSSSETTVSISESFLEKRGNGKRGAWLLRPVFGCGSISAATCTCHRVIASSILYSTVVTKVVTRNSGHTLR